MLGSKPVGERCCAGRGSAAVVGAVASAAAVVWTVGASEGLGRTSSETGGCTGVSFKMCGDGGDDASTRLRAAVDIRGTSQSAASPLSAIESTGSGGLITWTPIRVCGGGEGFRATTLSNRPCQNWTQTLSTKIESRTPASLMIWLGRTRSMAAAEAFLQVCSAFFVSFWIKVNHHSTGWASGVGLSLLLCCVSHKHKRKDLASKSACSTH